MTVCPTALLDTTVFCGALVKPDSFNMRLLILGTTPLYRPIISQAVIAEFIHKACTDGLGSGSNKRIYRLEEIDSFLGPFSEILDPTQAVAIRQTYKFITTLPGNTPLWVALSKFADVWPIDTNLAKKLNRTINKIDLGDFHLILTAIQTCPDVVVTKNKKDLQLLSEFCPIMTSFEFLASIDALD